jgi:hypothetical protein
VTIIVNTNPSKQRDFAAEELIDHEITPGDFVGTTNGKGSRVWHFDGEKIVMIGVASPDHRSMAAIQSGQSLKDALKGVPMFASDDFVIHRMVLSPGAYYPRIARPNDQHPLEAPGACPESWQNPDVLVGSLNQVRSLVGMLDAIFQAVHPVDDNLACFGGAIRNLLILACTECEAQWRGVLEANGCKPNRPSTADYVKLLPALKLDEYEVRLQHYPWLAGITPYRDWNSGAPTQSILWYDDYNAAKHDREGSFARASLKSAIDAVAAVWIMVAAQFGTMGTREFDDLSRYFQLERVPLWRYSDVYTYGYDGFVENSGPQNFAF